MRPIALTLLMVFVAAGVRAQDKPKRCPECLGRKTVKCETCDGKWRKQKRMVKCERKGVAGCDGVGYRKCFKCRGTAKIKCATCGGDGKVGRKYGKKTRGGWRIPSGSRSVECERCGGAGHRGCTDCDKVVQCTACERYWPRRQGAFFCPSCEPAYFRDPKRNRRGQTLPAAGIIKCPRCKGEGKYEKVGRCLDCKRGREECPQCNGTGRWP